MKKKVVLILAIACLIVVAMLPAFSSCTKRENVLKVLSWDEYLDETLIDEFEAYYQEVTGQKVKVEYQTTSTNETMYSKIATKQSDYDVLCPSDYMVEKMYKENLLIELEADLGEGVEDYRKNISPLFTNPEGKFKTVPASYVCAYMWGTMGIVYNRDVISTETIKAQGWDILFNSAYKGKIDMKNSVRDSYVPAAIYAFKNEILAGTMTIAQAINNTERLSEVKKVLIEQRAIVHGYEVDNGKTTIIEGGTDLLLQWSGDAVYTLSEELQEETLGKGKAKNLAYYVPISNPDEPVDPSLPKHAEGSNLWCDYWVIPKYAQNLTAANLWINFMCKDESAIANMDYIGYTTAVATDAIFEYAQYDETLDIDEDRYALADLSYFFTTQEGANAVYTDIVQFPAKYIVDKCEVMLDFGSKTQAITDMWNEVRAA